MYNKETSLRKRRRMLNKLQKMIRTLLRKLLSQNQCMLKNQCMLLHQPQRNKNRLIFQEKLTGQRLIPNKQLKLQINHFTLHSHWVIPKLLTQFQTTNHHHKKTQLKVDMLQFSLSLLQSKNLCMPSTKTSSTSINF